MDENVLNNLSAEIRKLSLENKFKEILELFSDEIMEKANNGFLYCERGFAYLKLQKFELAIADLTKSIDLNFDPGRSYNNRGFCYENLGNKELALRDYETAFTIDPAYELAINNYDILNAKIGGQEQPPAILKIIANGVRNQTETISIAITLKYKPYYFLLDQLIRILVFYCYLRFNFSPWILIVFNIVLLMVESTITEKNKVKLIKAVSDKVNPEYKDYVPAFTFNPIVPNWFIRTFYFCGVLFTYGFLMHVISNHQWYQHIWFTLVSLVCGGIGFLSVIYATIPSRYDGNLQSYIVTRRIQKGDGKEVSPTDVTRYFKNILEIPLVNETTIILVDDEDVNDAKIVEIESEVKTISTRVEAYLLESVLLGGLTFSGFLVIVSSENVKNNSKQFTEFFSHCCSCALNTQTMNWQQYFDLLKVNFNRSDLFILVMILCLSTSVFFLLVLTLRIRYMSLVSKMDHLQKSMNVFNAKEEEFLKLEMDSEKGLPEKYRMRLYRIRQKIDDDISKATVLLADLNPIVRMMSFCRNIGVITFYVVLIASGYFLSPSISLIILFIAVITISYKWIETFTKSDKLNRLFNHSYIKKKG